jgi:hypothetical protein
MSAHTPGPWVWGEWTILNEDRKARFEGGPYWTLIAGDTVLTQGPIGRKVRDIEHIIDGLGYEFEGLNADPADRALIAEAPEMFELIKRWYAGSLIIGDKRDLLKRVEALICRVEGDEAISARR